MKRYLRAINEQDSETATATDPTSSLPTSNQAAGESEMETDDTDPSPDLENGNESHPMESNGIESLPNVPQTKRLFSMDLVNLSGNTSLGKLKQNGKSVTLAG